MTPQIPSLSNFANLEDINPSLNQENFLTDKEISIFGSILNNSSIFEELSISFDANNQTFWLHYNYKCKPSFTLSLLREMEYVHNLIRTVCVNSPSANPVRWYVISSKIPGIFNYGGDLSLFAQLIRTKNRDGLLLYAHKCVQLVYDFSIGLNLPILTVALLQGDALGGGLESALASNFVVAEKHCKVGLPESKFGLFPGMGAYSFLYRKIGIKAARELIDNAKIITTQELYELGAIDLLVDKGEGEEAVKSFIRDKDRRHNFYHTRNLVEQRVLNISQDELTDVVNLWVDSALRLDECDIRRMEKISYLQTRKGR